MGADVDVTVSNSMSVRAMEEWRGGGRRRGVSTCDSRTKSGRKSGESGQRKRRGVWTAIGNLHGVLRSRREISASLAWHGLPQLPQLANGSFLMRIEYCSQQMDREAGFGPVKGPSRAARTARHPLTWARWGEMGEMDPPASSWRSLVVFAGAGPGNPIGFAVSGIYPCGPPGWIYPSRP